MLDRFVPLLLVLSLLLWGACSGPIPEAAVPGPEGAPVRAGTDPEAVTGFLREVFFEAQAVSYEDVLDRFGPPVRRSATPVAGGVDSVQTLAYHGMELSLREAGSSLAAFALTDARYTSPEGLRVGYAQSYVLEALGRPTRKTSTRYLYEQAGPPARTLIITFELRAVSRLEWQIERE